MITLKNCTFYEMNEWMKKDIVISGEEIINIGNHLHEGEVIDCEGLYVLPSFIDPHVHFREPGFEHKETIHTGSLAAAAGGYTTVFAMPNLNPVPDDLKTLQDMQEVIAKESVIEVVQLGSITKGQKGEGSFSDMLEMAPHTVGFSDDGRGIIHTKDMYEAMLLAKKANTTIIAHCEDEDLIYDGYIRKGTYSARMNHKGILGITETTQLARDLVLALETKVHFHVCHVSTKQSVDLIRFYKSLGCHVTCEVSPHHLILSEINLKEDGNFKMNPPLGSPEDKDALISGLLDHTIDCIATDHAPHAESEKKTLQDAAFGIVGLETAFPLLYTHFVKTNVMSLHQLTQYMSTHVSKIFNLPLNEIKVGHKANLTIVNVSDAYTINSKTFKSKSKNQPFDGTEVYGRVIKTMYKGAFVYGK